MSLRSSANICISFLSLREQGDLSAMQQACQNTLSTRAGGNEPQCTLIYPRLPEAGEQTSSLCLSETCLPYSELDRRWWESPTATEQPPLHWTTWQNWVWGPQSVLLLCSCLARAEQMCLTKSSGRCFLPRKLISSLLWQESSRGWPYPSVTLGQCAASSHCLGWGWGVPPQLCWEGEPPEVFCALQNEPWPTPQPFFPPCRNSFQGAQRSWPVKQFLYGTPGVPSQRLNSESAPTRGLFHLCCFFSLYQKMLFNC